MAAIDVTAVVSDIAAQAVPIGLVGAAVLLLFVAVAAFRWVEDSLGGGNYSDDIDSDDAGFGDGDAPIGSFDHPDDFDTLDDEGNVVESWRDGERV